MCWGVECDGSRVGVGGVVIQLVAPYNGGVASTLLDVPGEGQITGITGSLTNSVGAWGSANFGALTDEFLVTAVGFTVSNAQFPWQVSFNLVDYTSGTVVFGAPVAVEGYRPNGSPGTASGEVSFVARPTVPARVSAGRILYCSVRAVQSGAVVYGSGSPYRADLYGVRVTSITGE